MHVHVHGSVGFPKDMVDIYIVHTGGTCSNHKGCVCLLVCRLTPLITRRWRRWLRTLWHRCCRWPRRAWQHLWPRRQGQQRRYRPNVAPWHLHWLRLRVSVWWVVVVVLVRTAMGGGLWVVDRGVMGGERHEWRPWGSSLRRVGACERSSGSRDDRTIHVAMCLTSVAPNNVCCVCHRRWRRWLWWCGWQ